LICLNKICPSRWEGVEPRLVSDGGYTACDVCASHWSDGSLEEDLAEASFTSSEQAARYRAWKHARDDARVLTAFMLATESKLFVAVDDVQSRCSDVSRDAVQLTLEVWARSIDAPVVVKEKLDADTGQPIWRRD
jgi:hypothetical protein